jgi:SAM-dependent methyltransferase
MTDELARDPKDVVRDGYDAISEIYRADDAEDGSQGEWLAEFARALPPGGHVLDLGCGCGVPAARWLSARGFAVTGVDISARQIERARALVPGAEFIQSDMAAISFDNGTFDAVVSLYALIHLPVAEQPGVLSRIARWLRPGGPLLAIVGAGPGTGTEENWLGGGAQMFWSQPSLPTTLEWVQQAGLLLDWQRFIPEGGTGHVLIHARCRSPRDK